MKTAEGGSSPLSGCVVGDLCKFVGCCSLGKKLNKRERNGAWGCWRTTVGYAANIKEITQRFAVAAWALNNSVIMFYVFVCHCCNHFIVFSSFTVFTSFWAYHYIGYKNYLLTYLLTISAYMSLVCLAHCVTELLNWLTYCWWTGWRDTLRIRGAIKNTSTTHCLRLRLWTLLSLLTKTNPDPNPNPNLRTFLKFV